MSKYNCRSYNRTNEQIRPVEVTADVVNHAAGSVMLSFGHTKVLCTVSLADQAPSFLRNKKQWWLTASYALLPASTQVRTERESSGRRNDRSAEISRLIGRSLRAIVNLPQKTEEKTIHVDCDVIQADGGTRTACITAASLALQIAQEKWLAQNLIKAPIIKEEIAAVSIGLASDNQLLLDIDFDEDSTVIADFNFVLTKSGKVIEVQGSAEKDAVEWQLVNQMYSLAHEGIKQIFNSFSAQNFKLIISNSALDGNASAKELM